MSAGTKRPIVTKTVSDPQQYINSSQMESRSSSFDEASARDDQNRNLRPPSSSSAPMPPPCPGNTLRSAIPFTNLKELKADIMEAVKIELAEPTKIMSKILGEMELLKKRKEPEIECSDAACQTDFEEMINKNDIQTESKTPFASKIEPQNVRDNGSKILNTYVDSTAIFKDDSLQEKNAVHTGPEMEFQGSENDSSSNKNRRPVPRPRNTNNRALDVAKLRQKSLLPHSSSQCGKVVLVTPRQKFSDQPTQYVVDERECLANSLQLHADEIVSCTKFKEGEMLNYLFENGCLSEDEYLALQNLSNKDQIRAVLIMMKGRDFEVLKRFLKYVEKYNSDLSANIGKTFENNKLDGLKRKLCATCSLGRFLNVKQVADTLWAIEALDDMLYSKIVYSDAPTGQQDHLWRKVYHSVNSLNMESAEFAHRQLMNTLLSDKMFTNLASGVKEMLTHNQGKFVCLCEKTSVCKADVNSSNTVGMPLPTVTRVAPNINPKRSLSAITASNRPSKYTEGRQGRQSPDTTVISELTGQQEYIPLDKSRPKILKKPSRLEISTANSLSRESLDQTSTVGQTTANLREVITEGQDIPPLPVKKNKASRWRKGNQLEQHFV